MDWNVADVENDTSFNISTNNLTTNGSFREQGFSTIEIKREQLSIPAAVFLVACICVSLLGNGAVLYIAALKIKRSSLARLNLLISSLALSDFLQTFTLMIPQLVRRAYGEWICSVLVCKLHVSSRSMQSNISISTLTLITLERFLYLDKVSDGFENRTLYIAINVAIWCGHLGLAVPLGVWSTVLDRGSRTCTIPMKSIPLIEEYVLFAKTTFFFLPLLIMWICNIGIIYKTRKSSLSVQPLQMNGQPYRTAYNRLDREKRAILTCLALASVFTITNVPFETCLFVLRSENDHQHTKRVTTLMSYFWPLTLLNSCINPFIYSVFFKQFRQKVKKMMLCTKCKQCRSKESTSHNLQSVSSRTDQQAIAVMRIRPQTGTCNSYGNGNGRHASPQSIQVLSAPCYEMYSKQTDHR